MRISRHQMFMEMAKVIAKRSTCPRLNVGAIIVSKDFEIFMGYNGSVPGEPHCTDEGCLMGGSSCQRTIHAEVNAMKKVPDECLSDLTLYVTNSPCQGCTSAIINFLQIRKVYFENEYRSISHLHQFIGQGITVLRLVPNGCIMNLAGERIE